MRTAQEQQLINKLAHNIHAATPEEIQAITPEMLNSKINDGSLLSECYVAFALARYTRGREILAAHNHRLASQVNAETLNANIQQGPYTGHSVAFVLADHAQGREILAAHNHRLALQINTETLNAIIQQGRHAGQSVAFSLACFPTGCAILAANNNALALQINAETLNPVVQNRQHFFGSVAVALSSYPEGCAILAAIKERHQNNNVMLALYSSKVDRLGKRSKIRILQNELLGNVLTTLDGRTRQRRSLK